MENEIQLAVGTTTEQMRALYFNNAQLHEPSYRLWQLNSRGKRYYYLFDEGGEPVFFPSVTTILRNVMPENKILTNWKLSLGKEESEAYTMERASYGTFIHSQLAQLAISRKYNLDDVRDALEKYVEREKLPYGFIEAHEEEAKADIKAFATWMWDYDVRPYAVEVSLYSERGYAGMVDLAANLRTYSRSDERSAIEKANGDEKKLAKIHEKALERIDAIIDFKSGKKGFYDEYAIQLELYRRMWNENFEDKEITRIFNVAPKDWLKSVRKKPSYSFEEQTENPVLRKVDALLALFELEEEEDRKIVQIDGMIDLDSDEDANVHVFSLAELVKVTNQTSVPINEEEEEDTLLFANE